MTHENDRPREPYPNPTQQRMDEDEPSDAPADVSWEEGRWGESDAPHEEQAPGSLDEPETLREPHEG
jgi:hypothetical protein